MPAHTVMSNFLLFLTILACLSVATAIPQRYRDEFIYGNNQRLKLSEVTPTKVGLRDTAKTLVQLVDHFNRQDLRTFNQRYFVSTDYWSKNPDSPVFLCVGGEGPALDASVLVSSVHCNDMVELAKANGALMFALEHRYYGPSMPTPDYSTDNMKYLNTEQALEDLAVYVTQMNTMYNLAPSNKWVTWGGSYPGMVAGLARLRFPHLIHASVASSAPLQAAVNMVGYEDVVAKSMSNTMVGGSDVCLATIVAGHRAVGALLETSEGRRSLEKTFNFCVANNLEDPLNREQFAGDGVVYLPVQSNDPACTSALCNISSICDFVTASSSSSSTDDDTAAMQRLAALSSAQRGGACMTASFNALIKGISNPANPGRSWSYQTCNEWGFYQTCEVGSACPYVQGLHTLDIDFKICEAAFNMSSTQVTKQIEATVGRYGGSNIQGSRIMFPNGDIDPWHALSVLTTPMNAVEEPTLMVAGASHHYWTHPVAATDSQQVVDARQDIWNQVNKWLAMP